MILSLTSILQAFSAFILVSIITPLFFALFVTILIFFFYIIKFFLRTNIEVRRISVVKRSPFYSLFTEILSGISIIKAYKKYDMLLDQMYTRADEYHRGLYN